MLKNEKITNTKPLEKPEPALENKKSSEKSKYSFQEELKNLQKNKEKELNVKEENQDLEPDLSHLLFSGNLPYFFNLTEFKPEEKINYQMGLCYISKQPLSYIENDWNSLSLDRLNSDLGYTVENTIVVTKFVNNSKNNLSFVIKNRL